MMSLLKVSLILHVLLGLVGIAYAFAMLMNLLKREKDIDHLRQWSLLSTVAIVLSWIIGGYYYVNYYGTSVKPVVIAGPYSWAHTVLMEWKEHIFLFLPFLSVTLAVAIWSLGDRLQTDASWSKTLAAVAGTLVVIGTIVALAGVLISGAVR